jgi:CRISPR system Cascade subunit CasD
MDPQMSDSVYIRLAGPIQSWAGPAVTGNIVRTERLPTTTALRGLVAGALGARRGEWPAWLDEVDFTVREDRGGRLMDDYQTINPRRQEEEFRRRILLAQGRKARGDKALVFTPDAQSGTSIVNRTYIADAEFLVRITCPGHTEEIDQALASPAFSTYLGRKAFPAAFPFYLGVGNSELLHTIPLCSAGAERKHAPVLLHARSPFASSKEPVRQEVPVVESRGDWLEEVGRTLRRRRTL